MPNFPFSALHFSVKAETETENQNHFSVDGNGNGNQKPPEFRGNGNGTEFPHSPDLGVMGLEWKGHTAS